MHKKQVEVLKGNTPTLCPKNTMQKNSVFKLYIITHLLIFLLTMYIFLIK